MDLRSLDVESARNGLLIDLRPIDEYLDRHIRGSIPLLYEAGPGLSGRARDLLPLDARLIILEDRQSPLDDAAASFRGKGFDVAGYIKGGISDWPYAEMIQTPTASFEDWETGHQLLNVADPGTLTGDNGLLIPVERLWLQAPELDHTFHYGVLAGWGVRAAAAIGILEHLGFRDLTFVRTRPAGARPPQAGPESFRVGGPP